ncbi:hypothetical protein HAHI6034_10040 [Hathewaya histolytica]|uniref:Hydroxylamine reductase Hcp n=1 Tax=Hathewaya histolytica TaxID=1498 RepID=A0A4U9QWY3_HATHI|nr:hypothetical protein [Hathewaya histolytica]VTQ83344.1 hydroxylamine reductase Hcp [Hathewaya histolytica]
MDNDVSDFFFRTFNELSNNKLNSEELIKLIIDFGKVNLRYMQLWDKDNSENVDFISWINNDLHLKIFEGSEEYEFTRYVTLLYKEELMGSIETGSLKHFLLLRECYNEGLESEYFTKVVEKAPKDTIILALACEKDIFNKSEFETIGNIPRLLNIGAYNDTYDVIRILLALSRMFKCHVNKLPLSLVLSLNEEQDMVVLLTLISLGIKNIRLVVDLEELMPTNVYKVLVDKFGIKKISTPEEDLKEILI